MDTLCDDDTLGGLHRRLSRLGETTVLLESL